MKAEYDYLASPLAALRSGDARRAIRQLEELRDVKPELVEATYHLARAWQTAGDNDKAKAYYAEVLADASHPFFAHTRVRLSEMGVDPDSVRSSHGPSTGIVPDRVAEATGSEVAPQPVTGPSEEAAPEATQAEPAAEAVAEATQAEPAAEAAPSEAPKAKGKKAKGAAPSEGGGQDGASS